VTCVWVDGVVVDEYNVVDDLKGKAECHGLPAGGGAVTSQQALKLGAL
jgi:hypothetical protein